MFKGIFLTVFTFVLNYVLKFHIHGIFPDTHTHTHKTNVVFVFVNALQNINTQGTTYII